MLGCWGGGGGGDPLKELRIGKEPFQEDSRGGRNEETSAIPTAL